jgi:sulfite oxidase
MVIHSEDPLNCEPPLDLLGEEAITPTSAFYVRDHGMPPPPGSAPPPVRVTGLVERPLELSAAELGDDFPRVEITAALHCAGNRRAELMEVADIPGETP